MEWVFFLVELTTIAVYYSTWDKIDSELHLKVGWVYAGASACTLIIINGILTFMLTPGDHVARRGGNGPRGQQILVRPSSIPLTGPASFCAPAFAARWPASGRSSPPAASTATSSPS